MTRLHIRFSDEPGDTQGVLAEYLAPHQSGWRITSGGQGLPGPTACVQATTLDEAMEKMSVTLRRLRAEEPKEHIGCMDSPIHCPRCKWLDQNSSVRY